MALSRRVFWTLAFLVRTLSTILAANNTSVNEAFHNCSKPSIEEFPPTYFTQDQRLDGAVSIHVFVAVYLTLCIGVICQNYFVPTLEVICLRLNLAQDVAGATFMAAGTSAPEFFTNVMGTFVTESDLGVSSIVGSAVFNMLGVIALCGLFTGKSIPIRWYPVTRDCIAYGLTVVLLFIVLLDDKVFWYESLAMIFTYLLYIVLMYFNVQVECMAERTCDYCKKRGCCFPGYASDESTLLLDEKPQEISGLKTLETIPYPWERPTGCWSTFLWILFFPLNLLTFLTIPDVRRNFFRNWFVVSFIMTGAWLGVLCYLVAWMITIVGYTWNIPDSVMGLSFLAAGTSIPELISSFIVAKQGKGSMAISNSIGSNTFDILICLGVPWIIKSWKTSNAIEVNSVGMEYTVISLLISLILLYFVLLIGKFVINKTVGFLAFFVYCAFLSVSLLFELNVFFPVNLPACPSDY